MRFMKVWFILKQAHNCLRVITFQVYALHTLHWTLYTSCLWALVTCFTLK